MKKRIYSMCMVSSDAIEDGLGYEVVSETGHSITFSKQFQSQRLIVENSRINGASSYTVELITLYMLPAFELFTS